MEQRHFLKHLSDFLQKQSVRFGALEEVFMSFRPHGAWRTMEVLEELAYVADREQVDSQVTGGVS
jgi:hypothetical protein